jgi:pyruvate formate lyase activating enzyme
MSREVSILVDRKEVKVQEGITVKKALEVSGYKIAKYPEEDSLFVPCEVGGCWSCAVEVNEKLKPSCITPVKGGVRIKTDLPKDYQPKRIVQGFTGHTVGGVGTPWWLKGGYPYYIEVTCFAAGCNLRCPQCQKWQRG